MPGRVPGKERGAAMIRELTMSELEQVSGAGLGGSLWVSIGKYTKVDIGCGLFGWIPEISCLGGPTKFAAQMR